ncbi:50S ribosomal protein L21 [soil metagenome]
MGDVLIIDKVGSAAGESITLAPLLLVDGDTVTTDAQSLSGITVTAEVIAPAKGPKIVIQKFKNKTGYKRRQGHRQPLTQVKITAIDV